MNLNKTGIDDEEFIGNENDEQFAGNELDDSKSDGNLTEKKPDKPDNIKKEMIHAGSSESNENSASVDEAGSSPAKKKITIAYKISGLVILVCLIASAAYFFILRQPKAEYKPITAKKTTDKIEEQSLVFEPFIVPFENNKYYAYILVEISFDVSGKKLRFEMAEKQNELRKIMYDILLNEIEGAEAVPSAVEIKNRIKSGINAVLENGKIQEVFVTKFLAV